MLLFSKACAPLQALLWLAWGPLCATAQTPSDTTHTLPAARVEHLRVPSSHTAAAPQQMLDSLHLSRTVATSLANAAAHFAGVIVRDYGGAGGLKTLSVRGLGASHTVVAYDGIVVGDAQNGQIDLGRFPLSHTKSLSLHTADEATLLTTVREQANATLHISTLQSASTPMGLHGNLSLSTGSFGLFNPSMMLSAGTSKRHSLSLMADFQYGKNEYPFLLRNGVATHTEHRLNSRLRDATIEVNDRIALRRGSLLQSKLFLSNRNRQLPGPVTLYVQGNHERMWEREAFVQSRWKRNLPHWQAFAAGKGSWKTSRYEDRGGQYPNGVWEQHYRQRELYFSGGGAYKAGDFQASLAADYAYADLRSNISTSQHIGRHTLLGSAAARWKQERVEATLRLTATALWNTAAEGIASERLTRLSPSATVAYTYYQSARAHAIVRAHWKNFFRPPTFSETHYYHLGNPQLRPERTQQTGLGTAITLAPARNLSLALSADGYYNHVKDKISAIPYNLYIWRMVNLGKVRAWGIDLTAQAQWTVAVGHTLSLQAQYTLQSARDFTSRSSNSYRKQLAYVPRHSATASLAWENPWLNAAISLQACSMRWATNEHSATTQTAGFAEWNAALWRNVNIGHHRLSLRFELQNMLNHQYSIIRRYPMPGRAWKLMAQWHF